MSFIKETEEYVKKVIDELGYDIDRVKLEPCKMREFGQYQINVAMQLAKASHKNPREVADQIVAHLDERFTNVNVQGPGFINVSFSDSELLKMGNAAMNDFDKFVDKTGQHKTIVLDYGGANIAKELHVGHLRCNIGEAMRRLLNLFGDKTISDVHWGDWGTPLGLVIREIQEMMPDLCYFQEDYHGPYPDKAPVTNDDLGIIYPCASKRKKEDSQYAEEARLFTARLQNNDPGITELWRQIVDVSKADCQKVYDYLNCHFDYSYGESNAHPYVPKVIDHLKAKNVTQDYEGALIMPIALPDDKKEMPPLFLVKSDGAVLYDTTELATLYQRMQDFKPDEVWYFTDERQSLHFEQIFRAAYKSELVPMSTNLKFFGFGTINGKDGKPFKTRDGGIMSLKGLIKIVYDKIEPNIKPEIQGTERDQIASKLTVATLKFADLSPSRKTDYNFDVDKFCSFDGKTGIYIVYTTTRIISLLNKVGTNDCEMKVIPNEDVRNILVKITELPKALTSSYNEVSTNYICDFVYELCSLYNKFYTNNNISNEQNENVKNSYLALTQLVYNILTHILDILAIETVDKM